MVSATKNFKRRQGFYTPYPILKNKRELTVEMSLNFLLVASQVKDGVPFRHHFY